MKSKYISEHFTELLNTQITVCGWVVFVRKQKDITFIKLSDGTCPDGIQLTVDSKLSELDHVTCGSSLSSTGTLVKSPAEGQAYELSVISITILGQTDPLAYPLSKGKLPLDYLRSYPHLRMRTSTFGSVFRIKSAISLATILFYFSRGFVQVNPNILTVNECEGGAGVFQVIEQDSSDHSMTTSIKKTIYDWFHSYFGKSTSPTEQDTSEHQVTTSVMKTIRDWFHSYFGKAVFLTVSSQLQLEPIACSIGSVFTMNKSFRSEHSSTHKHLSEFEHLEIEDVFIDLTKLMSIGEDYIKFVAKYLLDHHLDDITNLDKFVSKGLLCRTRAIVDAIFRRITYHDAIELLKTATTLSKPVEYGDDLCSEFENYLTDQFGPVFVTHWPIAIKSFYMKQCEDGVTCENFDLLMPYKVGELIGGSMREDDLDKMLRVMQAKKIDPAPLEFYLDLRRFGSVPHGGFGLGLDRLCMLFTGMENIRDVVAFPVSYKSCDF